MESKARYDTHSAISCPGYLYQTEMPADKRGVLMEGSSGVGGWVGRGGGGGVLGFRSGSTPTK